MNRYLCSSLLLFFICFVGYSQHSTQIKFEPNIYYHKFLSTAKPVLKITPGDTIVTSSVDAGGYDKNGKKVTNGGNPLTGPFYVMGAGPGDLLVVKIIDVALNRNYATTFEIFVPRSVVDSVAHKNEKPLKPIKWNLDLKERYATPDIKYEHLENFRVPLRPMLGCIGVAPKEKEILTYDAGPFGGNLDFNRVTASATVYLPVFHDGALLYMGDGHAVQGDGELTGSALETSMDFSFVVKVIKNKGLEFSFPGIEDDIYLMSVGLDKNLDKAIKLATSGLLRWVQSQYKLSFKEATQVLGTSIEYRIAEIADPKVEVVAMIKKEILKGILRANDGASNVK